MGTRFVPEYSGVRVVYSLEMAVKWFDLRSSYSEATLLSGRFVVQQLARGQAQRDLVLVGWNPGHRLEQ
jgi:hypothetical protein